MFKIETRKATCQIHGEYESRLLAVFGTKSRWSSCQACNKLKEQAEADRQKRVDEMNKQHEIESRLNRCGVPPRLKRESFDTFKITNADQKRVFEVAKSFVDNFKDHQKNGTGLIFSGGTGTGKGHLAAAIAAQTIRNGHSAYYSTLFEMIMMMRASWSDKEAASESDVLKMLGDVSLLVIDEVGLRAMSEAERGQIFNLINRRYENLKPTILTTNLASNELEKVLGERSFSRLIEVSNWVSFKGIEDYRAL
jgi:DNA replication protein DnaC